MKKLILLFSIFCLGCGYAERSFENVSSKLTELFDKVERKQLTIADAILEVEESDIELLMKPSVIHPERSPIIAEGKIACTGASQGVLCFDLSDIERLKNENKKIIWVTDHIKNDDLCYLRHFDGIFALNEDPSSHAIIVTRVYNIPCLTLPENVTKTDHELITSTGVFRHGDEATIDAFNGRLLEGSAPLHHNHDDTFLNQICDWSETFANLEVHGNADCALEAQEALDFGARGVDPRTEHMFFQPERLHLFRKAILLKGENEEILNELKELQKGDFTALFQTVGSYPAKIRLLDPPLHEFLPQNEDVLANLADDLGVPFDHLVAQVQSLQEANPMMGHRGVRLLLTHPSLLRMQVRAIFEASLHPSLEGKKVKPHIVIPMIISVEELEAVKKLIEEEYAEVMQSAGKNIPYALGIMMETPRACLLSDTIAPHVDFISFGTNDLTGQTLALSRGDVYDKFLKFYLDNGLLNSDPFMQIDPAVERLMQICVSQIRAVKHDVIVGICGEHASQKVGVFICHRLGFNTVSCSASRVPVVKVLAAQAAILYPR